jgi:uncharacterized Zn finger protein
MSRYYGGWAPYVPVAERRRKAAVAMEKLRKKGAVFSPVTIEGKKIAATFWGKAWCQNLESYRDYESRLGRGRTYVRNGSVVDLQIKPNEVTALVGGSEMYTVRISIGEVVKAHWKSICADCSGGIDSLVELLQGRLSKGVMERICRQGTGLFPKPSEIRFSCSCPDHASMCKHVAAALYGVGSRLDVRPELLFLLRAVSENDLVLNIDQGMPLSKQGPAAGKVLETDDMAALFGLDMGGAEAPKGVSGIAVKVAPRDKRSAIAPNTEGSEAGAHKVPTKRTARTAKASSKPVAGATPAASDVVAALEAVTLANRVEAVPLKVRRPVGRPPKTAPARAAALNKPAGTTEAANPLIAANVRAPRQKARNQPTPGQEPVQWWVEGWNGGRRFRVKPDADRRPANSSSVRSLAFPNMAIICASTK